MNVEGVDPQILLIYRVSDVAGVLLMGIIGGTIARHRGYDIIGFFFIALFSALGGGMTRDVLINQGTVAAMAQPEYLALAFTGALIARFVYFKGRAWELFQVHGDAVVSGLWAATGCVKALTFDLPLLSCVMMGVLTAVGGGMIRDVVTGQVPGVFGDTQPTVIPAIAATLIVLSADHLGYLAVGMILGPIVSIIISVWGYWANWRVSTDKDWAPVNVAAMKLEQRSRRVARELEPTKVRAWRHRQMEKALERRNSKSDPKQTLEAITSEFEVISKEAVSEQESGVGVDLDGTSYENYDQKLDSERLSRELIDMVLADELLTDELLTRLEKKYRTTD